MGLADELRILSEQIRRRQSLVKGEEATKQSLIMPLLQTLGYDIYDPAELQPEYVADFAKSGGNKEKVDYAIHLKGVPAIFVEAKAVGTALDPHGGQLARYFNATPSVKTGILTNGVKYRFYTDLQEPNIMSEQPFFEFDILSFSERDVDMLRLFTKEVYDANAVHNAAEDIIYIGKLTSLVGDLLRNPSESFVRYLLGEIDIVAGKRLTAKVVERFIPVVRKAIQTTLLEMATRSIKLETEIPQPAPAPAAPEPPPTPQPIVSEKDPRIITTAEELEGFELIRKWCSESTLFEKNPITYRDSQSYFGIHLQASTHAWFVRLFADSKRKALVTKISVETVKLLSPGFDVEPAPASAGVSRIYINNIKDLEKLRTLIFSAYEDAIKRRESGKDEPETPTQS
jgi:hypothetical protein